MNWMTERKKISELIPASYNPRKLNEKQYVDLNESLNKFNLADPIIINKDNKIIGGHQRIKVLADLGTVEVDVRVPDRQLSDDEEKELNLRLNKNLGEWDFDLLKDFDKEMLADVGFDSDDLDKLFPVEADEQDDVIPETEKNQFDVVRGDIWQLGRHRLMCGDSTSVDDVGRLMGDKKAQMIHTDPPYNVDYGSSKNPRHKIRSIENDSLDADDWESFCKSLYSIFKIYNEGDIYMWGASGPEGMRMRLWLVEYGCHWSATIIWKKQQLVLSPAKYQRMYEPCFYGWFDKSTFGADRKQTEVWDLDRPLNSKLHPTMKPIELCSKAIQNSSKWDDIVLDLFLGAGSTLIACEKTNRICHGMEIDEHYCSVIINRWQEHTGQKAERING